jgi:hypothetical protein
MDRESNASPDLRSHGDQAERWWDRANANTGTRAERVTKEATVEPTVGDFVRIEAALEPHFS